MASTYQEPRPIDFSVFTVEESPENEPTTHVASCHCGTVKFTITLKHPFPKYPVNKCSCSICFQNGYLFVYPVRRDVMFTSGYENLSDYKFGPKLKSHKFCKSCGSSIGIDFNLPAQGEKDPAKDILAINVRNFKDIDLDAMEYTFFDGKNLL